MAWTFSKSAQSLLCLLMLANICCVVIYSWSADHVQNLLLLIYSMLLRTTRLHFVKQMYTLYTNVLCSSRCRKYICLCVSNFHLFILLSYSCNLSHHNTFLVTFVYFITHFSWLCVNDTWSWCARSWCAKEVLKQLAYHNGSKFYIKI